MIRTQDPPAETQASAPLAIDARNLSADYGGTVVLSRVSLSIRAGALVAVVGPGGAGKTTLLRCLLGRHALRAGEVQLFGQRPRAARERIGYLPQHDVIDWSFPLTVLDLVLMGSYRRLGLLRRPGAAERASALAALRKVGLERLVDHRISELDPGQRRHALLARALLGEPDILLLDEPTRDLEPAAERELLELVERQQRGGQTVVVSTLGLDQVVERFDDLVLLNVSVVAQGPPGQVLSRENLRSAYGSQGVPLRVQAEYFAIDGIPGS